MRRQIISLAACLALASAALVANSAEQRVYQWTDSNGVVHYSQFEPDKTKSQARDVRTTSDPKPPPEKTPDQIHCDTAKANLALLTSGKVGITLDKNGDGKPDVLSEDEAKTATEMAEQQIKFYCKG